MSRRSSFKNSAKVKNGSNGSPSTLTADGTTSVLSAEKTAKPQLGATTGPATVPTTTLFRTSPPRSKNLLVINKGVGALTIPRAGTAWDLMEIFFLPVDLARIKADPTLTPAEHVVFETSRKMRKFAIIQAIFEANPFWEAYDAIMMFDDDVMPVGCDVADIFELFAQTGCRVGQPALTPDSFYGHVIHIKNDNYMWRRTNCAELMCPIMTREALREYLPMFNATISGFGLDDYWSFHEWLKGYGLAILDRTPVRHSRPVGGGAAYQGLSQDDECRDFMRQHAIPRYPHSCYGGVLEKGGTVTMSELAPTVTGYQRKYITDPRFHIYAADQVGILANAPPPVPPTTDVRALQQHIEALTHVAAVALYMTTRDFRYTPPPPQQPPPPAGASGPSPGKSFWSWLPWWPWW